LLRRVRPGDFLSPVKRCAHSRLTHASQRTGTLSCSPDIFQICVLRLWFATYALERLFTHVRQSGPRRI